MCVHHGETNMAMVVWVMYLDTSSVWTILTSAQYAPLGYPHHEILSRSVPVRFSLLVDPIWTLLDNISCMTTQD